MLTAAAEEGEATATMAGAATVTELATAAATEEATAAAAAMEEAGAEDDVAPLTVIAWIFFGRPCWWAGRPAFAAWRSRLRCCLSASVNAMCSVFQAAARRRRLFPSVTLFLHGHNLDFRYHDSRIMLLATGVLTLTEFCSSVQL